MNLEDSLIRNPYKNIKEIMIKMIESLQVKSNIIRGLCQLGNKWWGLVYSTDR